MTRLSKSREQEIRKHWAKMSKKDGFEFFGYSELLAELDATRAERDEFKETGSMVLREMTEERQDLEQEIAQLNAQINAALRGDKDSPIVKAVSHQLGVRDLMEERDSGNVSDARPAVYLKERRKSMEVEKCPRCKKGELEAVVSEDGSAYEADECNNCGASWWNDPPKYPHEIRLRVQGSQ